MRKKFTTTLTEQHRIKLRILTAKQGFKNENEMIEFMIDTWGEKYDLEDERNRPTNINRGCKQN